MSARIGDKGFTLIELLVAMLFLMFVMIGFLRGILYYVQYSLDARMKDYASKSIRDWPGFIESLPYNHSLISPSTYPQPTSNAGWDNAFCNPSASCTFENSNADSDGIPDFYDPYNGNNDGFINNTLNTANWLLIKPNSACTDCPPLRHSIGNREVYVGVTLARLVQQNNEIGKAFGITAWYFSPIDRKYKYVSTTLIKRKP
ncbi:MAG: prepilin-type N-terminal cleavage/methylation domain-containing protein [Aquificaceae bacterium]